MIGDTTRDPLGSAARLRVVVDLNRCQGYAQCCYAAPGAFTLHGHEILSYDPAPAEARRGEIERAVQACPVRAISLQAAPDDAGPEDPRPDHAGDGR